MSDDMTAMTLRLQTRFLERVYSAGKWVLKNRPEWAERSTFTKARAIRIVLTRGLIAIEEDMLKCVNTKVPQTVDEYAQHYVDVLNGPPNAWGRHVSKTLGLESGAIYRRMLEKFGQKDTNDAVAAAFEKETKKP